MPAVLMEQGLQIGAMSAPRCFQTFESNILYSLRFMIDCQITGGQWVTLPESTYYCEEDRRKKLTHCQYEVHVHYGSIESHPPEGMQGFQRHCKMCLPWIDAAI